MKPAVEINQLSKKYKIEKTSRYLALRDTIAYSLKNIFKRSSGDKKDFWALQDINLKIEPGERLGIIGKNGAGKSTLLKLLSRVTYPTTGEAIIRGRLASLLEVGTGFHPELTGRENIYLNGSILGLKKAEIERQFDAIVDFSGVEPFLDTALKNYSSGMQLRLAFAVAAHLEPEILLIDEVLAVGDMEFQKKCLGKMEEVSKQQGRTILFVSHNMNQLKSLCTQSLLMEKGRIIFSGNTDAAIRKYSDSVSAQGSYHWQNDDPGSDYSITKISLKDKDGNVRSPVKPSEGFFLEISVTAKKSISNSLIAVRFANHENIPVFTTTNADCDLHCTHIPAGQHLFHVPLPPGLLIPGRYYIVISWNIPNVEELDKIENEIQIEIEDDNYPGYVLKDGRLGVINKIIRWEKIL